MKRMVVTLLVSLALCAGLAARQKPAAGSATAQPAGRRPAKAKTPEEKEADAAKENAYKESLKKIPNAKVSSDPWGGVRNADAPKTPAAKTTASAKPKAKTGGNAN